MMDVQTSEGSIHLVPNLRSGGAAAEVWTMLMMRHWPVVRSCLMNFGKMSSAVVQLAPLMRGIPSFGSTHQDCLNFTQM